MSEAPVRIGLVGYGVGGRLFHAPYIAASTEVELVGVVARSQSRRDEVAEDFPGLPVFSSLAELLDSGVDAVTVTTPPQTRHDLVLQALEGGAHVVADKPFAPDVDSALEMVRAARTRGLLLTPFHNRRWDSAYRTAQSVLSSGRIGEAREWYARMDHAEASSVAPGPGGGVLNDLGAHLFDQALHLLGPAAEIQCDLSVVDAAGLGTGTGPIDAGFHAWIRHEGGATSYLEASKLRPRQDLAVRLDGTLGSVYLTPTDVQVVDIMSGRRPTQEDRDSWGIEPGGAEVVTLEQTVHIPAAQGDTTDYYDGFGRAVRGEAPLLVTAEEGIAVVAAIEAARTSYETGAWVAPRTVTV